MQGVPKDYIQHDTHFTKLKATGIKLRTFRNINESNKYITKKERERERVRKNV